ncbi:MAG TPA: YlxM family DNA-binding protein [Candidatus Scybalocola faecipullorum]|nr:YlxM family DNA-binding protein [Candidatus Scybalocola faecipullorum]
MEKILEQSLLFDFYGELLTPHQKSIYEDFVQNDLTLGEIAGERGISRQGVYDIVRRCNRQLEGYEQKLHLVDRFMKAKSKIEKIHSMAGQLLETPEGDLRGCREGILRIEALCDELIEEL